MKDLENLKEDLSKLEAAYGIKLFEESSSHGIPYYNLIQRKFIDYKRLQSGLNINSKEFNSSSPFSDRTLLSYKKVSKFLDSITELPYDELSIVLTNEIESLKGADTSDYVIPSLMEKGSLELTSSGNLKVSRGASYGEKYFNYIESTKTSLLKPLLSIASNKGLVFTGKLNTNSYHEYNKFINIASKSSNVSILLINIFIVIMSSMIEGNKVIPVDRVSYKDGAYDSLIDYYSLKSTKYLIVNKIKSIVKYEEV